jgi:hypothetical protein
MIKKAKISRVRVPLNQVDSFNEKIEVETPIKKILSNIRISSAPMVKDKGNK